MSRPRTEICPRCQEREREFTPQGARGGYCTECRRQIMNAEAAIRNTAMRILSERHADEYAAIRACIVAIQDRAMTRGHHLTQTQLRAAYDQEVADDA